MMPFAFQHAFLWQIQQLWFLFMVSIPWLVALHDAEGDETFNLKIGFDLTRGAQGASSLRLRNFEENDPSPYNEEEERSNPKLALRALSESSSSSSEDQKQREEPNVVVEMKAADSSQSEDESDGSDGNRNQLSTKGLRADEYEPKGPAVREALNRDSDNESGNSN